MYTLRSNRREPTYIYKDLKDSRVFSDFSVLLFTSLRDALGLEASAGRVFSDVSDLLFIGLREALGLEASAGPGSASNSDISSFSSSAMPSTSKLEASRAFASRSCSRSRDRRAKEREREQDHDTDDLRESKRGHKGDGISFCTRRDVNHIYVTIVIRMYFYAYTQTFL